MLQKGHYPEKWIWNSLPFKRGHHYNLEDGKRALRNVYATDLYENVQVIPRLRPPEEDPTQRQVVVEVRVEAVDLAQPQRPGWERCSVQRQAAIVRLRM